MSSYATDAFIAEYQNSPARALARIDTYAIQNENFDSQLAAKKCGLVWTDQGFKLKQIARIFADR